MGQFIPLAVEIRGDSIANRIYKLKLAVARGGLIDLGLCADVALTGTSAATPFDHECGAPPCRPRDVFVSCSSFDVKWCLGIGDGHWVAHLRAGLLGIIGAHPAGEAV